MFTIKVRLATVAISMLFVGVPILAHAEPEGGMKREGRHGGRDGGMHQFVSHALHSLIGRAKDLGLSDEQVTKLKVINSDYEKTKIRGEADLKLAEVDVQTLAHDEKADMAAIEAAVRKSEAAHSNLRLEGIKALRAAAGVLTPEQREKWRGSRGMRHGDGKDKDDYKAAPRSGPPHGAPPAPGGPPGPGSPPPPR
jgi:Spy/CpxP family protein refolding chaperone